ncbi:MAG: hypothetical protein JWN66_3409 [Sphingomonas bacterium]|uniref:hypothetical protein n=1 Tax=Sphingomonas bacterium TaxID=1895847 RepID=UPI002638CBC5|nr:hypothetical protein [Sphingomonas bacterium]MDB5706293.1 hypothetical protein [Sphingomonas bacterium]
MQSEPEQSKAGHGPGFIRLVLTRHRPALIATFVYILLCVCKTGPIRLITGDDWHGAWDQSQYLRSTLAFAHADFAAASHWYPLLYPLAAVPFAWVMPGNPYLLLDILCVFFMIGPIIRVAAHLGIDRRAAMIVLLLTLLWPPQLWGAWVRPWTTTLSAPLIWWLLARAGDILVARRDMTARDMAWLGCVAALVPLVRPADAVIVAMLGGWLAIAMLRRGTLGWHRLGGAVGGAMVPLVAYGALHLLIYGPRPTDYMLLSAEIGTCFSDLGWKMSILFVDPRPWYPQISGVLGRMPWVALGLAGALFALLRNDDAGRRGYAACLLLAATAYVVVLTAYADFLPSGLWKNSNIHYLKWVLPLLGMMAWLLVRDGRRAPFRAGAAMTAIFLLTGLRLVAVPAGPGEDAWRLDVPAPRDVAAPHLYAAKSSIVDPRGNYRNIFEFRQIMDGPVVHVISIKRPFAPGATWVPQGVDGQYWPANSSDPVRLPEQAPVAPIGRWKTHLTWGLPCWLGACPTAP